MSVSSFSLGAAHACPGALRLLNLCTHVRDSFTYDLLNIMPTNAKRLTYAALIDMRSAIDPEVHARFVDAERLLRAMVCFLDTLSVGRAEKMSYAARTKLVKATSTPASYLALFNALRCEYNTTYPDGPITPEAVLALALVERPLNAFIAHQLGGADTSLACISDAFVKFMHAKRHTPTKLGDAVQLISTPDVWDDLWKAFDARCKPYYVHNHGSFISPSNNSYSRAVAHITDRVWSEIYTYDQCITDNDPSAFTESLIRITQRRVNPEYYELFRDTAIGARAVIWFILNIPPEGVVDVAGPDPALLVQIMANDIELRRQLSCASDTEARQPIYKKRMKNVRRMLRWLEKESMIIRGIQKN